MRDCVVSWLVGAYLEPLAELAHGRSSLVIHLLSFFSWHVGWFHLFGFDSP
jgi:hypothetical protein